MLGLVVRYSACALRAPFVIWKREGLDLWVINRPALRFQGVCFLEERRIGAQEKQPINYNSRHSSACWDDALPSSGLWCRVGSWPSPETGQRVGNLAPFRPSTPSKVVFLWPSPWEGGCWVNCGFLWPHRQHCLLNRALVIFCFWGDERVPTVTPHSCPQLLFASGSDDAALLVTEHSRFFCWSLRGHLVTDSVY